MRGRIAGTLQEHDYPNKALVFPPTPGDGNLAILLLGAMLAQAP